MTASRTSSATGRPGPPPAGGRAPTVGAWRSAGRARLAAAGADSPGLDAELLLAHALGFDRAALFADPGRRVSAAEADRFEALLRRREACQPVAYILGRRAFRRLELAVDARVLIPRPETELLLEAALDLPAGARVVDVGTGSGAVALALADERPELEVTAVDIDPGALAVARANARRLKLEIAIRQADLLSGAGGPFDAVLANLPYVARSELDELPAEIVAHEPRAALLGGDDGLDLVRRLIGQAVGTAFLALEVGAGQAPAVSQLAREAGFADVGRLRDLSGIERVIVARTA